MFMDPDATGTPDPSPRLSSRGVAARLGGPDQRHAERDIMSRFFTGVDRLLPFRHGFIEASQLELEGLLVRSDDLVPPRHPALLILELQHGRFAPQER